MLNFNPSDSSVVVNAGQFLSQIHHQGEEEYNMGTLHNQLAGPALNQDSRTEDHNNHRMFGQNATDQQHISSTTIYPFMSDKGSENVKRFSVNNLLQLAQCSNTSNMLTSRQNTDAGEFL